jgi:prevent-host-death family protein
MKYATTAELRAHLSAFLKRAEAGERVLIRRRGEVVAELRPASEAGRPEVREPLEQRLDDLERAGFLRRGSGRWPDWSRRPITGEAAPVLEALLDEREDGR